MKLDDTSWHEVDADEDQAAVHIAIVFCWLLENNLISEDTLKEWDISYPLDKTKKPTYYLGYYSDNKLISEYVVASYRGIFEKIYNDEYLRDVGEPSKMSLIRDQALEPPYDVENSWENVDQVGKYFTSKKITEQ